MSYLSAAVLGIVQGLGEFLPISSSAHLVLVPWFFGWTYQGLTYDVALHWGTMIAVCAYFRRDWARLIQAGLSRQSSPDRCFFWSIVLATIPGGLAGLLLNKTVERVFHAPSLIAGTLIVFGIALWAADRLGHKDKAVADVDWKTALLIGLSQALAIVPGVSRSGITITAGLFLGLKREDAARFSFLLSVPIMVAAGLFELRHAGPEIATGPFWFGILITALTGWAAIRFLLSYLQKRGVAPFAIYRIALGLVCLIKAWA